MKKLKQIEVKNCNISVILKQIFEMKIYNPATGVLTGCPAAAAAGFRRIKCGDRGFHSDCPLLSVQRRRQRELGGERKGRKKVEDRTSKVEGAKARVVA